MLLDSLLDLCSDTTDEPASYALTVDSGAGTVVFLSGLSQAAAEAAYDDLVQYQPSPWYGGISSRDVAIVATADAADLPRYQDAAVSKPRYRSVMHHIDRSLRA